MLFVCVCVCVFFIIHPSGKLRETKEELWRNEIEKSKKKTEGQSRKDCYRAGEKGQFGGGGGGLTGAPKSHFNRTRSRQLQAGNMAAVPSSSFYISSPPLTKKKYKESTEEDENKMMKKKKTKKKLRREKEKSKQKKNEVRKKNLHPQSGRAFKVLAPFSLSFSSSTFWRLWFFFLFVLF